jgi:hypothetical protein
MYLLFQGVLSKWMLLNRVAGWKLKVFFDNPTCVSPCWMTLVPVSWVRDKVPLLFMVVATYLLLSQRHRGQGVERWWGRQGVRFTILNRPFWCQGISNHLRCIDLACGVRISWGDQEAAEVVVSPALQLGPFQRSGPCTHLAQRS